MTGSESRIPSVTESLAQKGAPVVNEVSMNGTVMMLSLTDRALVSICSHDGRRVEQMRLAAGKSRINLKESGIMPGNYSLRINSPRGEFSGRITVN